MAKEYIDRNGLIEALNKFAPEHYNALINQLITKYPTADVVEVEKYNELRENFVDFACSGVNNLAPYCKNRCVKCVNERGWCRYGDSCKGFNPDGERRDT